MSTDGRGGLGRESQRSAAAAPAAQCCWLRTMSEGKCRLDTTPRPESMSEAMEGEGTMEDPGKLLKSLSPEGQTLVEHILHKAIV